MAGYEGLRAFVLGQEMLLASPQGLALFLRQGMAGWIKAWHDVMTGTLVKIPASSARVPIGALNTRQVELAAVLAGMALAAAGR